MIQMIADSSGNNIPASNASTQAGAVNVRRKLSSIFQRPIAGIASRFGSSLIAGPRPNIQGRSCQSPRAHR